MNGFGKLLIDLGPLVVFFVANSQYGIMVATAAFMVATVVSLSAAYAMTRTLPATPLVSGIFVLFFGGLTLVLQNETFIKIKPTLVYTLFAAILFAGIMTGRQPLQRLFDTAIPGMSAVGWRTLTLRWAWFFLAMAAANEIVWRSVSTDAWVSAKLFGFLPASFLFAMLQTRLILRHSDLGQSD